MSFYLKRHVDDALHVAFDIVELCQFIASDREVGGMQVRVHLEFLIENIAKELDSVGREVVLDSAVDEILVNAFAQ